MRGQGPVIVWTDGIYHGGCGRYNRALLELFREFGLDPWFVHVTSDYPRDAVFREDRTIYLPLTMQDTDAETASKTHVEPAFRLFRALDPRLVLFSNGSCFSNLAAKRAALMLGRPIATIEHNAFDGLVHWNKTTVNEVTVQYQLSRAAICVSDYNRRTITGILECPPETAVTIHNFVGESFLTRPALQDRPGLRRSLGIADDEVLVVSTGAVTDAKGIGMILELLEKDLAWVRERRIRFLWAGKPLEPPYLAHVEARIREAGAQDRFRILGWVQEVEHFLDAGDIFLLPSYNEAFCLSIAEAMARGLPVITSDRGGIPELTGPLGLVVEKPWHAAIRRHLERLIGDPVLRRTLGAQGRERVATQFTRERWREAWRRCLTRLDLVPGDGR